MKKKEIAILLAIFALACAIRLFFSYMTPYLSSTDSYYNLRIAENLKDTIIPKFYDTLSYGGKTNFYSPVFHYLAQPAMLISQPETAAKIFSSILISTLIFPIFLISKKLTGKTYISLLTAFLSIFIPSHISLSFNTFTPYSIMAPLIFLTLYLTIEIKKYTTYFIICSIIGALINPIFLLLIIGFIIYLILIKTTGFETDKTRTEAILFSTLLTLWIIFVIYKNALLMHGLAAIWQNTPQNVLRNYFFSINIPGAAYMIGLVPLLAAIYTTYRYISHKLSRDIYLILSFGLSTIILTTTYLLRPDYGLAFTGIIATILFGVFVSDTWDYLANARSKHIRTTLITAIMISLIFTNIMPSMLYIQRSVKEADISEKSQALEWIKENTQKNDIILSSLEEGHLVSYIAQRKNVIDENFLNQPDAEKRAEDTDKIYKTSYSTEAIPLLNKYKVNYILFTPDTAQRYNINNLRFVNQNCFELVYNKETKIYKSLCKMEE